MTQIRQFGNLRLMYWFLVFTLLLVPVTKSFFVNLNKLIKTIITSVEYQKAFDVLREEKKYLSTKVKNYQSTEGLKSLIKDRLDRVEKGELLIKFNDQMAQLAE